MTAPKLTPKQTMFIKEYLVDLNATQAAIRAGYSVRTAKAIGQENLTKPDVQSALQKEMDKRSEKVELTADDVLRDIKEIKARCMQAVPVLDRNGNPTGEYKFDATNALKACELEGKHLKLFTDKHEVTGKDGAPLVDLSGLTTEELRALAKLGKTESDS